MQIAAAQVDQAKRNQIRKSALEVFTLFDVTVQLKAVHDLLVYVNELPLDLGKFVSYFICQTNVAKVLVLKSNNLKRQSGRL